MLIIKQINLFTLSIILKTKTVFMYVLYTSLFVDKAIPKTVFVGHPRLHMAVKLPYFLLLYSVFSRPKYCTVYSSSL